MARRTEADDVVALLDLTRSMVALAMRTVDEAAGTVTLPQFRALMVLERTGPCNAGGLAEHLGTHPSTVTRICDRLVALRYVTRETKPDNRREVELDVTRSGRAVVRAVAKRRSAELGRWLDALEPQVRGHLAAALPTLVAAAERANGPLPSGWAH